MSMSGHIINTYKMSGCV